MKTRSFLLALMLMMTPAGAGATTRQVPVLWDLTSVAYRMVLYQEKEGRYPVSWEELEKHSPGLRGQYPELTQRLEFLLPPVEMGGPNVGKKMVLITRDSYREQRWTNPWIGTLGHAYLGERVYGVAILSEGGASSRGIRVETLRKILKTQGRDLPEPSGLGSFPHERGYYASVLLKWLLGFLATGWIVWRWMPERWCRACLKACGNRETRFS